MEEEKNQPIEQESVEIDVNEPAQETAKREQPQRARKHRRHRIPGLIGLIPDSVLPPEGKEHLWQARRESLLAGRSLVKSVVQGMKAKAESPRMRRRARCVRWERDED